MTPPPVERRDQSSRAELVQRSLTACWKEGIFAQVMITTMDTYVVPYCLFMGGTMKQIGLAVALPNLLLSLSQFFAVPAVRAFGSRKRLLLWGVALQVLILAPLAFLAAAPLGWGIALLISLTCAFRISSGVLGPAWGSLVSEYLPETRRGQYFGMRARIIGVAGLGTLLACGLILDRFQRAGNPALGFAIIFAAAAFARLCSLFFMNRMADLPMHRDEKSDFTFWMFLRRFRESNFVKFIFYVSAITFATQISAPFFSVYMLRDLQLSYRAFMAVSFAALISGFLTFSIWGRHADVVGNAKILKITGAVIPFIPLLWLFTRDVRVIIAIELFAGFIWGGFNLCVTNFIYDAVSPDKRVRCLGYFNLINGAAACLGAWTGGLLADRLPPVFGYRLLTLFCLSAALRFLADLLLSRHFHEVRASARRVSSFQLFFSVVGARPIIGRNEDMAGLAPGGPDAFRRREGKLNS